MTKKRSQTPAKKAGGSSSKPQASSAKKKASTTRKAKKVRSPATKKSERATERAEKPAIEGKTAMKQGGAKPRVKARAKRSIQQPAWWGSLKRSAVAMENALNSVSSDLRLQSEPNPTLEKSGQLEDSLPEGQANETGALDEGNTEVTGGFAGANSVSKSDDASEVATHVGNEGLPEEDGQTEELPDEPMSEETTGDEAGDLESGHDEDLGETESSDEDDDSDQKGEEELGEAEAEPEELSPSETEDDGEFVEAGPVEGVEDDNDETIAHQEPDDELLALGTSQRYKPSAPSDAIVLSRAVEDREETEHAETDTDEQGKEMPRDLDLSNRDISWRTLDLLQEDVHRLFLLGDVMGALVSLERIVLVAGDRPHVRAFLARNAEKLLALYEQVFGGFDRVVVDSTEDGPLGPNILGPTLISEVQDAVDGERTMQEIIDSSEATKVECATVLHYMLRTRRVMFR